MSEIAASSTNASPRTGGPDDPEHGSLAEHIAGWTLVIVLAMLLTLLHLA